MYTHGYSIYIYIYTHTRTVSIRSTKKYVSIHIKKKFDNEDKMRRVKFL